MYTGGEQIEPGRVVCIDHATGLLWLPNAAVKERSFWGISRRGHVANPANQTPEPLRKGRAEVQARGSYEGVINVHAASVGEQVAWRGMVTSLPPSSEVGAEVLELRSSNIVFDGASSREGHWGVRVSLP